MGPFPPLLMDSARLVWPGADLEITRATRSADASRDYVVLPHLRSPRWLLPADAPSTAAALTGQESSRTKRAAVRLLALAHRTGLTSRLPFQRLRITVDTGGSLPTLLAAVMGEDVDVALRLGSWAHARSLVVRIFGPDGSTLAFGKVGIDAHGRASVTAEHANLSRVADFDLRHIRHSEVLHHDSWRGLEVLLVSPLLPPATPDAGQGMPTRAMNELAHAGTPRVDKLGHSQWESSIQRRLQEVSDPGLRAQLASSHARLERTSGDLPVPLGCWHGDWTPWNMAWDGSCILLWDWEHFAEDVPVGFDLVHYVAQELRITSGTSRASEEAWRTQVVDVLSEHVALSQPQQDALIVAYLLEVNLRFVLDRQSTPEADRRRDGWGMDLLRREAGRLAVHS